MEKYNKIRKYKDYLTKLVFYFHNTIDLTEEEKEISDKSYELLGLVSNYIADRPKPKPKLKVKKEKKEQGTQAIVIEWKR